MKHRLVAASAAIVAALTIGCQSQPTTTQPTAAARAPRNAAEFDELFNKISNWGRWGKDDQLGAANLITDAKRRQAAALVKNGVSVSLAHDLLTDMAADNQNPASNFEHVMNKGFQTDVYRVSSHSLTTTHIDTLCHVLYEDKTYNGYA